MLDDFHLGRSHRRGATTRETAAGVAGSVIYWMNQKNIGAEHSAGPMRVLYRCVQNIDTFLRFSKAL